MRRHLPERLRGIRAGKTWVCRDESFYFGLKGNFVWIDISNVLTCLFCAKSVPSSVCEPIMLFRQECRLVSRVVYFLFI